MKTKNYIKVLLFAFAGTFVFSACQKGEDAVSHSVEGIYIGNFTTSATIKSAKIATEKMMDTAIVKMMSNGQINVHCFGDDLDSTIILNTYQNGDSMMVCLDGQYFEGEYGHMMGDGSMMGNNSTEWGQHMNGEPSAQWLLTLKEHIGSVTAKLYKIHICEVKCPHVAKLRKNYNS